MVTLSKPRSRVPFANVKWSKGINLLKGVICSFVNVDPIPEDPEKATDENFDTYMSETKNIEGQEARFVWDIPRKYAYKVRYKLAMRCEENKPSSIIIEAKDLGHIQVIGVDHTDERIYQAELSVNGYCTGLNLILILDGVIHIKVYEVQLIGK
jgi:hypothetical protein